MNTTPRTQTPPPRRSQPGTPNGHDERFLSPGGKNDWTSSPLPRQRQPIRINAEECFSSPKPARSDRKENVAPLFGQNMAFPKPAETPSRLPMVQEQEALEMPTVEDVHYMPAWVNQTPTPDDPEDALDAEPKTEVRAAPPSFSPFLKSPKVRNTFLQFESPLQTICMQTPPRSVPSFFAPAGLEFLGGQLWNKTPADTPVAQEKIGLSMSDAVFGAGAQQPAGADRPREILRLSDFLLDPAGADNSQSAPPPPVNCCSTGEGQSGQGEQFWSQSQDISWLQNLLSAAGTQGISGDNSSTGLGNGAPMNGFPVPSMESQGASFQTFVPQESCSNNGNVPSQGMMPVPDIASSDAATYNAAVMQLQQLMLKMPQQPQMQQVQTQPQMQMQQAPQVLQMPMQMPQMQPPSMPLQEAPPLQLGQMQLSDSQFQSQMQMFQMLQQQQQQPLAPLQQPMQPPPQPQQQMPQLPQPGVTAQMPFTRPLQMQPPPLQFQPPQYEPQVPQPPTVVECPAGQAAVRPQPSSPPWADEPVERSKVSIFESISEPNSSARLSSFKSEGLPDKEGSRRERREAAAESRKQESLFDEADGGTAAGGSSRRRRNRRR